MEPAVADHLDVQKLVVTLTDREDGGVHIHSLDVPGLHLSGADRAATWSKVPEAVKALMAANKGRRVLQVYLPAFEAAIGGPSPRDVAVHVRSTAVYVELEPLAA